MKVSRQQAAENRGRIIDVAGRLFRERGFDGIGVADLMKAAGLTHGGFYGHFRSKEDLAALACAHAMAGSTAQWAALVAETEGGDPLAAVVDRYLSPAHRDNPGKGCTFAALAADAARQPGPGVRQAFTQGVQALAGVLARLVPGRTQAARRRAALARLSGMVGALALARAVDDADLSDEILAAARIAFGGHESLG